MIRKILSLAGLVLLLLGAVAWCQTLRNSGSADLSGAQSGSLRLMTWNVHYIRLNEADGPWSRGDWDRRKGPMNAAFRTVGPDVAAFQEMESFAGGNESRVNLALDWLLENNPGFAAAAVGDPAEFPSTQPILFRRDRLELLDQGWFFFSETPGVIYSRTFNGSYPAFASWARFRDRKGGAVFRVVNVHTDFGSASNRLRSVELTASRVGPWIAAGETVFLAGDLNARLGSRAVEILEAAGLSFLPVAGATYHFNRGLNLFGAIDHLAWSGAAVPEGEPVVLRRKFDGEWPTDHYPVVGDFSLRLRGPASRE